MDLFDRLQEQIENVRLPLFAVTVTAAAQVMRHSSPYSTGMDSGARRHWSCPALKSRRDRFQDRPS